MTDRPVACPKCGHPEMKRLRTRRVLGNTSKYPPPPKVVECPRCIHRMRDPRDPDQIDVTTMSQDPDGPPTVIPGQKQDDRNHRRSA